MPDSPNKLSQFWQELKRRKVLRVITVYAAVAFVILQLVEILAPSLRLPDWTMNFILVILIVGFIIAIILSWIYDIHPEGRIVKTEPAHEIIEKVPEKPSTVNAWKIATAISVVVIVVLIIFNIFGRREKVEDIAILDKSIAVLPFVSLSDDPEKQYLADGTMDAILLHLSKIKDLRVMARTSVEQYRKTDKTASAICQELDVAFLLEGSFQKYGDQARLIVQLIEPGREGHIWAKEYDRNWTDIFSVQSEVAQTIARELQAVITPEEKQLIEKIPTASLTAYDYYQRGREEYRKYNFSTQNTEVLQRAEDLYRYAIENDSTFAQAYTGLAQVYWDKHYWKTYLSENFLDSALILANIALDYDEQLAEAYVVRGRYYLQLNKRDQAIDEFNKAIKFNPNDWMAYNERGQWYSEVDFIEVIVNHHKAASLNRGPELPSVLNSLYYTYMNIGLMGKAKYYAQEILKLDGDSVPYYDRLSQIEYTLGNFAKAVELGERGFSIDTTHINTLSHLVYHNCFLGQYEESLRYYEKVQYELQKVSMSRIMRWGFRGGFIYWKNGFKEKANHYLNRSIEILNKEKELAGNEPAAWVFYDLAAAYAFKGEKDNAYENLRKYNQKPLMSLYEVARINNDPIFDSIRDEQEFQQIVRDVEAKYQAEHERVRKWLEENDML